MAAIHVWKKDVRKRVRYLQEQGQSEDECFAVVKYWTGGQGSAWLLTVELVSASGEGGLVKSVVLKEGEQIIVAVAWEVRRVQIWQ